MDSAEGKKHEIQYAKGRINKILIAKLKNGIRSENSLALTSQPLALKNMFKVKPLYLVLFTFEVTHLVLLGIMTCNKYMNIWLVS